jgi:DNA-binding SARP family transcriptional activator/tetratricopeptide (TPR) repeat protein
VSTLVLQLFGPPHLSCGERRIDLPLGAPTGLLACLGTQGDWMSREQLALLFWPDAGTSDAQRLLRVTLYRARALLRAAGVDEALVAERLRLRLNLPTDVARFRRAMAQADWAAALALHRAPLLEGQSLRGFAGLQQWLGQQQEALLADWRTAALHEANRLADLGGVRRAVALLQTQLQADLLAEDMLQALLRHAAAADARLPALAAFERFCTLADTELGLTPLPATVALAQALRQHAPAPPSTAQPSRPDRRPLAPAPLLGRAAEHEVLRTAGPGLQLISGESGLGKTSLVQAVVHSTHAQGVAQALWLQAREDWAAVPLFAVCNALRPLRGELDRLGLSQATTARLQQLVENGSEVSAALSPPTDAGALMDAVVALLRAWPRPIVVDDLHWLDAVSLDALAQSFGATSPPRVLATLRETETTPALQACLDTLDAAGHLTRLPLPPLPADTMAELVAFTAGRASPRFAAWLTERTGGNPFFALECLAALDHAAPDELPDSAWAQAVPVRVTTVLQRRFERLGDATQRVLTIAAAAGDAERLELLAGLAGLSAWATAQALAEAQRAGLLRGRRFAHGLVRELVWQQTPEPLRVVLHAGLARRLSDALPPHLVAAHWWAAGATTEAVTATLAAAGLDASRGLFDAADQLLTEALARVPINASDDAARLEVKRAFIARQHDDLDAADQHLAQALAHLPLPATQQMAWGERFELALLRGQLEVAETCLEQARALDPQLPTLWLDGAKLAHAQGEAERCAELMTPYVAWLRRRPPGADLAGALTGQGVAFDMLGQHAQAQPLHQEALSIARRIGARHTECEVMNNLVVCLGEMGRDDEAVRLGLPLLKALQVAALPLPSTLAVNVAYSLLGLGRLDEAEPLYRRLAEGELTSVACAASGKLLEIQRRRGAPDDALGAAADATFIAMAATEMYTVQVSAMLAVLLHGRPADAPRVLPWLRDEPLPAGLQDRLDQALQTRGLSRPPLAA